MNMKIAFFAAAVSLTLVACGSDNSSSASDGFVCEVTLTANTVKVFQSMPGVASYTETGTLNNGRIDFVQEYEYVSSSDAQSLCASLKEEAEGWNDGSVSVTCSGNKITRTDYSETTDIASYADDQKEQCAELKEEMQSEDETL